MELKQQRWALKTLVAAAIVTISGALLTGCSTGTAAGEGTLTFAYPSASSAQTWETMAQQYTEETGVKVEVEALPIDSYGTTLTTRLQGGNAPDLFLTEPGVTGTGTGIVTLAQAGMLGEITAAGTELIDPAETDAYVVDGKVYGFPLFNAPRTAVVINENLEASGTEWPTTIDQMLEGCAVDRSHGLSFTLGQFGSPLSSDAQTLVIAASSVYAEDPGWDDQRASGETTFSDTEGWRYALQTIADMFAAGCYQDGAEAAGQEFWGGVMGGETPPIVTISAGEADLWHDLSAVLPDKTFSVRAFPGETADDRRIINSVKFTLSYNAASESLDAAKAYADWLAEPEQLEQIAYLTGGIPAGEWDVDTLPEAYQALAPFIEADQVISEPGLTWPNGVLTALQEGVPGLLTGQKTVDQVLADLDAAWDQ